MNFLPLPTYHLPKQIPFIFVDGEQIKLPESLESLPKSDHFPTQRHRWNTNEVSNLSCIVITFFINLWQISRRYSSGFTKVLDFVLLWQRLKYMNFLKNTGLFNMVLYPIINVSLLMPNYAYNVVLHSYSYHTRTYVYSFLFIHLILNTTKVSSQQ